MTTLLHRPTSTDTTRAARPRAVLAVVLVAQFMAVLDVTIVNVAAPTLRTDLHASGSSLQLSIAGYTVSYAVLLIAGARLGDRLGHGRVFRAGLAGFVVASLLCGLAPTTGALIAFRLVQGVGAALMMPQVMSLIQRTFTGPARARALSLYSAVIACGSVAGQVFGGLLVSADVFGTGWRPVFLVNVPIGAVLLVLARKHLPFDRGEPGRRLDPAGTVTLGLTVLLLVLPLVLGHQQGWPAWCFVSLAAGAVMFAVFVLVERRVQAHGGSPLVSQHVLRAPGLLVGAAALFVGMANYGGYLFAMALHLQSGLGESPAHAGLAFAPAALGFALTGLTWQRLPQRWHGPSIPAGLVVAAASYLAIDPVLHGGGRGGVLFELVLFVLGLALGLAFSPMIGAALANVPVAHAADASGVVVTVFQLGQVVGVATLGTTYLSLVHGPGAHASADALGTTLIALSVSALAAAVLAYFLVRRPRNGAPQE